MLTHLQKKIEALQAFSFEKEGLAIVQENKEKLADLQAAQLYQGLRSDGKRIEPGYAPFTIEEKKRKGQPFDRVTFRDTGELYKSFFAEINSRTFSIKSNSFKFGKMIKRSGVNTVGLNNESRETFVMEIVRPEILDRYEKKVVKI